MPKLVQAIPEVLRVYQFHKLDLNYNASGSQATGDCPFCGGSKFFVGRENGVYSCKQCEAGYPSGPNGNAYSFLRKLHQESTFQLEVMELIAGERGLMVDTLERWGLTQSLIDHEWMLPGYGLKGEINNLYRWPKVKQSNGTYKRTLIGTATMGACLFGVQFWDPNKPDAYICEGPWDAMRLEEVLSEPDTAHLYERANVVAVPGKDTFKEDWLELFTSKNVYLSYDSDHPKTRNGKLVPPGGYKGMQATAKKLRTVTNSIQMIVWGREGFDPNLHSGFDTRDYFPLPK